MAKCIKCDNKRFSKLGAAKPIERKDGQFILKKCSKCGQRQMVPHKPKKPKE